MVNTEKLFPIMGNGPMVFKVSIVLASYNRISFLKKAITSVREEVACETSPWAEIIVIDGGSTDGSLEWLITQKDIITIVQHNRGQWLGKEITRKSWGYFMNLGFKCAKGKYICMLSDDCLVVPGAIKNGVALFESKLTSEEKVGSVAFYWRNWPDNEHYHIARCFGLPYVNHGLFLRSALEEVDYCDEDNYMFYLADTDLELRMREAGYVCIVSPDSYIEHFAHANEEVRKTNMLGHAYCLDFFLKRWNPENLPYESEEFNRWECKQHRDYHNTVRKWSKGIKTIQSKLRSKKGLGI